jgi:phospholipid/cholesterol/gamma-HCH transport system substrate-binding protein
VIRRPTGARRVAVLLLLLMTLVGLAGCGMQAYDLPLPGKQVKASDGYQVTADFADVVDVVPRTLVMANDVAVGQVDSVKRVGWHAEVTMTIRKDIVLPSDAVADVRQTSLLGEKYVSLAAPTGSTVAAQGRLTDGAHLALASTTRSPEVEEVLGALSSLLAGGGVGQLKTISTELNKMMDGRTEDIRGLLDQVDTLVGSLDAQKDDIINAMTQVDRLTTTLNGEKKTIGDAIDSFGPALEVLDQQHRDLTTMLQALDDLGTVATRVIHRNGADITAVLKDLQPTLTKLADAGDSLPRGLMMAASFPFPKQAATLAKGDYSNALFHMDLDLNKVLNGLATGGSTGLPQLLQLCGTYSSDCDQLQPIVKALCKLTGLDFACSMVGKGSVLPSTATDGAEAPGSKIPDVSQSLPDTGSALQSLTSALVGGLQGTSGSSGTSPSTSAPGGIAGLAGSLLGILGGAQ